MNGPKKKDSDDTVNTKIQDKFDLIFNNSGSENEGPNEESSEAISTKSTHEASAQKIIIPEDNGLDFSLDFGDDELSIPETPKDATVSSKNISNQLSPEVENMQSDDFELDAMFDAAIEESQNRVTDGTQKTILFDRNKLAEATSFKIEAKPNEISLSNSSDSEDVLQDPVESTIKDILRPNNQDSTQEFDLSSMVNAVDLDSTDEEFSLDSGYSVASATDHSLPGIELKEIPLEESNFAESSSTGEFDLNSVDFSNAEEDISVPKNEIIDNESITEITIENDDEMFSSYNENDEIVNTDFEAEFDSLEHKTEVPRVEPKAQTTPMPGAHSSQAMSHSLSGSDEDHSRIHATIRLLREEREELLNQIKNSKAQNKELEQDNLTLKAMLDEAKIENSIFRKRHFSELEDIKFTLSLNEEKRAMAEEKARAAELKNQKLEQRVRIDINQVKSREKELETKLEMLSIDIDSQVQSRDKKILELRRKIDSLEFNMENASIKEHKTQDDKRKIEDKLNKIMKTLRHSIKNLEEDIDQASSDNIENNEEKVPAPLRFGKV